MPSSVDPAARMPNTSATTVPRLSSALRIAAAAIAGLLAGVFIQTSRMKGVRHDLKNAGRALQAARLEATLGAAVIEAQSGRYEIARQRASNFYTGLQERLLPEIAPGQQAEARLILAERDSVITALARNDPISTGTLAASLVRLRETIVRAKFDTVSVPAPR